MANESVPTFSPPPAPAAPTAPIDFPADPPTIPPALRAAAGWVFRYLSLAICAWLASMASHNPHLGATIPERMLAPEFWIAALSGLGVLVWRAWAHYREHAGARDSGMEAKRDPIDLNECLLIGMLALIGLAILVLLKLLFTPM